MLFLSSADFFKINFFQNFFEKTIRVETVWIQVRHDILSGLIWIQTAYKGYQQTTLIGKELTFVGVGPDLGPNCLQRLSANNTSRQRADILTGLIWVQTVYKGHQQTTLVGRVNAGFIANQEMPSAMNNLTLFPLSSTISSTYNINALW